LLVDLDTLWRASGSKLIDRAWAFNRGELNEFVAWYSLYTFIGTRIRELGLRRAKGADRARIRRQILAEIALMTSIGIVAGGLLLAQLPMLGWLGVVPVSVFVASLLLAATLLTLLTTFCGWYPALLATRIPPADALRYE